MAQLYLRIPKESRSTEFVDDAGNGARIEFGPFSRINLLVGANNSRKSRFCRFIMGQRSLLQSKDPLESSIVELQDLFRTIAAKFREQDSLVIVSKQNPPLKDSIRLLENKLEAIKEYTEAHPTYEIITIGKMYFETFLEPLKNSLNGESLPPGLTPQQHIRKLKSELSVFLRWEEFQRHPDVVKFYSFQATSPTGKFPQIQSEIKKCIDILEMAMRSKIEWIKPRMTYLPTLRGMIPLKEEGSISSPSNKLYEDTIRANYKITNEIKVWTGLDLYTQIRELRNDQKAIRERFEAFEEFLSKSFFQGKSVDVVATNVPGSIRVWVEGQGDRELYDLGDGIQAIINLMFPLFMADERQWFFIEEPELHLHPGFQTLLMNTLLMNEDLIKKSLNIFLTTHSNHLLDTSLLKEDVSIFTVSVSGQVERGGSMLRNVEGGDVSVLDTLGIANSSVFIAQTALWVEGVTDRIIINAYLEVYSRGQGVRIFAQDLHYSFLVYAGSNVRHYLFSGEVEADDEFKRIRASALGNRVWLLADQDADDNAEKSARHEYLKQLTTNHFEYVTTGCREIENTIPWSILKSFLIEEMRIPVDVLARKTIVQDTYASQPLGRFLRTRFGEELAGRKLITKHGALTNYYKNKLAEFVHKKMLASEFTMDVLAESPNAMRLAKGLHQFLSRNCSSN